MKAAPSGNAELDALAAVAGAADKGMPLDAEQGPFVNSVHDAPPVDPATAWAQFPALFGKIITPAMPELQDIYSEAACMEWGRAMVPLAEKYGWSPGAFMEWLGPWAGAAMATWPLAWPTVQAVRARRADKPDADKPAAPSNVVPMPGRESVDPDLRDPTETNRPPRPAE